jgi:hypothetical protein
MQVSSLPSLWGGDEVEVREDGFLWLKDEKNNGEQPLLLHSTEILLHTLYPSLSKDDILKTPPFPEQTSSPDDTESIHDSMDVDTDSEAIKDSRPKKSDYDAYQSLERVNDLASQIDSAFLDIRYLRHRQKRDKDGVRLSRDEARIRALERQQERLLSQRSESHSSKRSDSADASSSDEDNNMEERRDDAQPDEDDEREPSFVRLARTINSIRALFPRVLPILNHEKRNDKEFYIGATTWKNKRKSVCWLLGAKVFDVTTQKFCKSVHDEARRILEEFVGFNVATTIVKDRLGAPEYWGKTWIGQVLEKGSPPAIGNPLVLLATTENLKEIEAVARSCDEKHMRCKESDIPNAEQRYQNAIKRLHERLTNLLTRRFPKARLSIYGSCFSDLSLGKSSDVDLSLWIPDANKLKEGFRDGSIEAIKYERDMKRLVFQVCRKLEQFPRDFRSMTPITRARVPVVKGAYSDANNPHSADGSIK